MPGELSQLDGVDVATHPVVVGAAIAAAVLWLLSSAVGRAAGPVAEAWQRWRQLRAAGEDARIRDLSHQVDHLTARVWHLEQQQQRQTAQLIEHARWDYAASLAAIQAGVELPPMPPLRPTGTD